MPLMNRIAKFASSPQGRKLLNPRQGLRPVAAGPRQDREGPAAARGPRRGRQAPLVGPTPRARAWRAARPRARAASSFQVTAIVRRSAGRRHSSVWLPMPSPVWPYMVRSLERLQGEPEAVGLPVSAGGKFAISSSDARLSTRPSNSPCAQRASEGTSPARDPAAANVAASEREGRIGPPSLASTGVPPPSGYQYEWPRGVRVRSAGWKARPSPPGSVKDAASHRRGQRLARRHARVRGPRSRSRRWSRRCSSVRSPRIGCRGERAALRERLVRVELTLWIARAGRVAQQVADRRAGGRRASADTSARSGPRGAAGPPPPAAVRARPWRSS